MPQIVVRPAAGSDAERLAELMTQLGYPADAVTMRARLDYWHQDPASRVLVAQHGDAVTGCISVHAIPYLERTGRWLRIESLVVDAGQRRSGTGRALMDAAHRLAREWSCLLIEVTSLRSRSDAQAFYRRLGFSDAGDRSGRFIKELAAAPDATREAGRPAQAPATQPPSRSSAPSPASRSVDQAAP
jgi:GNAT superfamily N-acetyltransferase